MILKNDVIIKIENFTKEIKKQKILDNINMELTKGKTYGIIGHNGSGKTVLFKSISGLLRGSGGTIKVFGKIIGKDIDFPESLGVIIENPGFLGNLTGFNNLKILASIKNIINHKEIKENIELVGLDPNDKKKVKNYSLGMKQRLGIAQAIMERSELLILDEPTNGLDKDGVEAVRELLLELKKQGKTILLASHNPLDIEILCDEIFELDRGKILRHEIIN